MRGTTLKRASKGLPVGTQQKWYFFGDHLGPCSWRSPPQSKPCVQKRLQVYNGTDNDSGGVLVVVCIFFGDKRREGKGVLQAGVSAKVLQVVANADVDGKPCHCRALGSLLQSPFGPPAPHTQSAILQARHFPCTAPGLCSVTAYLIAPYKTSRCVEGAELNVKVYLQ